MELCSVLYRLWWITSTVFPLVAGAFGPLANLASVCALVQTWRVYVPPGASEIHGDRVADPAWLVVDARPRRHYFYCPIRLVG